MDSANECPLCGMDCQSLQRLRQHLRECHCTREGNQVQASKEVKPKKQINIERCKLCPFTCDKLYWLRRHYFKYHSAKDNKPKQGGGHPGVAYTSPQLVPRQSILHRSRSPTPVAHRSRSPTPVAHRHRSRSPVERHNRSPASSLSKFRESYGKTKPNPTTHSQSLPQSQRTHTKTKVYSGKPTTVPSRVADDISVTLHPSPTEFLAEAKNVKEHTPTPPRAVTKTDRPIRRRSIVCQAPATKTRSYQDAETNTSPSSTADCQPILQAPRTENLTLTMDLKAHIGRFGEIRLDVVKAQLVQPCPALLMAEQSTGNQPLTLASGTTTLPKSNTIILQTAEQQVPSEDHPAPASPVPTMPATASPVPTMSTASSPAKPTANDQQEPAQTEEWILEL